MNQILAQPPISQPVTRYCGLSTETLYSLYRHEAWVRLDEGERLDLLQETVNREVQANGAGYRCELSLVRLFQTTTPASKAAGEKKRGGKNTMQTWQPKPVSREDYDAQLRRTVNKLYIHEENDPAVSKEEAVKITGETAEKYLSAMEEFDMACAEKAAQETALSESAGHEATGEPSLESGCMESCTLNDSCIDGGADGGIDGGIDGGAGMDGGI